MVTERLHGPCSVIRIVKTHRLSAVTPLRLTTVGVPLKVIVSLTAPTGNVTASDVAASDRPTTG
jgi:hypothetical protein